MKNERIHIFNKDSKLIILIAISFFVFISNIYAARIKDIAVIQGTTDVQAIGYGIVTGLNNTGDNPQTYFTNHSLKNLLLRFGITISQDNLRVRNIASVMVTATIPSFLKSGSKIDVTVSSIGDASSLQGGVLLLTPLSLSNGDVIGTAQGPISVGGYDFSAYGSRISKNIATTARIPNGMVLEKDINANIITDNKIKIVLREPDYTTAMRVRDAVANLPNMNNSANTIDAATVEVQMPAGANQNQIMQLISQIELLNIVSDQVAKVVINERTGTIVVGGNVQLLPATIAHSGLEITIQKQVIIPQPAPFTIYPPYPPIETAEITAKEEATTANPLVVQGATVQDMANALNALKVKPRDLIAIFQALKAAGSLQGELIIQ
ncbi:MAG TPA: flagellar basal body P-ring protein FlgI [Bacteroidota bacterium]|nr:flagellar basal body P-ring protein FlgI [Candidatus Kapabacteria bacterium]HRS01061.1 flagellar basal body P-ring protein FlgI [Bacteroidota bacterium]HRT67240.1 flagellar basal body P-ring protein FlgI [Bacteroidota bacterium]